MTKSETRRERARQNKKERDITIKNGRQKKKDQDETKKKRSQSKGTKKERDKARKEQTEQETKKQCGTELGHNKREPGNKRKNCTT